MRVTKNKEDEEFAKYAESFLKQISSEANKTNGKITSNKSLLDYIKELDKRERKRIEEKYIKLFMDNKEKKKRIKKKRKKSQTKVPSQLPSGKYDPYFNYLPFEKAVIESNGKTPFDNKEVERIVYQKHEGSGVSPHNVGNAFNGISPITRRGQSTVRSKASATGFTLNTKPTDLIKRDSQMDFTKQVNLQFHPQE